MKPYVISCCSAADLSKEHFEREISSICFFILSWEERSTRIDLGASVPPEELYRRMLEGKYKNVSGEHRRIHGTF